MKITDIRKQDKNVEVTMIEDGIRFDFELDRYNKIEVEEVFYEVINGLLSYDLPNGEEADGDEQGMTEETIKELLEYYAE